MEGIVNPLSGRIIQVGGSTHKKLIREGVLGVQLGGGLDQSVIDNINKQIRERGEAVMAWPMDQWGFKTEIELGKLYNVTVGGRMGYEMENPYSRMIEVTLRPKTTTSSGRPMNAWMIFARDYRQKHGRMPTAEEFKEYQNRQNRQKGGGRIRR